MKNRLSRFVELNWKAYQVPVTGLSRTESNKRKDQALPIRIAMKLFTSRSL